MKPKRVVSPKLRNSARGRDCTVNAPGICNYNPETTVLAHLQFDGGKMGSKTDDFSACYACSCCNNAIDSYLITGEERWYLMSRALIRTQRIWLAEGLMKI